jgi:PIN domain nuclease of toxin-antitoxin system
MRLLIDSHVLLWAAKSPALLSERASAAIGDTGNEVHWSLATAWELAIKQALGKLFIERPVEEAADALRLAFLPISLQHVRATRLLPLHHRDPFDRMLVAQAVIEDLVLVTRDKELGRYPVATLW